MPNHALIALVAGLVALGALLLLLIELFWPRGPGRRHPRPAGRTRSPGSPPLGRAALVTPPGADPGPPRPAPPEPAHVTVVDDLAGAPPLERQHWTSIESAVLDLVRRHDFDEAHRRVAEALDEPGLPPEATEALNRLDADVLGAEVGHLTAAAIGEAQHGIEVDALSALRRAEDAFRAAADSLVTDRREEAMHRLWLACTRLAGRRLEARDAPEALELLFRSASYAGAEPARLGASTAKITRAVDALVEQCSATVRNRMAAEDAGAARAEVDRCEALLRRATAAGVPERALESALATVRRLLDHEIGGGAPEE